MNKTSIGIAWLARARAAAQPAAETRRSQDRLDVVLPRGWPESGFEVTWRWRTAGGQTQSGQVGDLQEIPPPARSARTWVWTPAGDTVLTSANLPTRAERKIAQALPFALEDRLLGDPETLHFAYRTERDGSLSVAVTAHERVRYWVDALTQAGLHPVSLCPAVLMVPWARDCWSLVFSNDELLVRSGDASGFVTPLASTLPPPLLVTALQEAARAGAANPTDTAVTRKTPDYLVVFNAPAPFSADAWSAQLQVPVRVETAALWEKQPEPLAPLNLLQGRYAVRGQLRSSLRPYIPAAAMLLIWLLGNFSLDLADWWKLHRQHQENTRTMTSLLLSSFPETKTVLDPAAQMQRSVDALLARHGTQDLLPMLSKTAAALRADPRVRLRGLRYAEQGLTLELSWPAAGSADAVKVALESAGLRTETLSVTPRADQVDGRWRLQPADARPAARKPS